jgi:signal transduction histidine kinase
MHFDDRLATVLRLAATSPAMARIQFRQLIDLLGREASSPAPSATLDAAVARMDELAAMIPAAERAAILREPTMRLGNADLVASLTLAEPEVASAAIAAADLSESAWLSLIPSLPVRARGILRHRGGYGANVEALLERLGIGDRALPPVAVDPARVQRPELVVLEGGAATKPRRPSREEPSTAGIGSIVRRIEAFRKAQTLPETDDGTDALDREQAGTRARTAVLAFDFTTDAEGRIDWADGPLAPGFVGSNLAILAPGRDDSLRAALRHRQPLRDTAVNLTGAPALAGPWRLDALPLFGGSQGAFLGYAGRLRRSARQVSGQDDAPAADSMREVLHELRTPANAIQVAAEIIQQQLYGPAPHEYRALAAAIAGDTAQILAGFEELDRLVRLESGTLTLAAGECDLGPLVFETVARLRAWTTPRNSGFTLPEQMPHMVVALQRDEAARLLWRMLAALAGVSAAGETIDLTFSHEAGKVVLGIDVPASLAQRLDEAVEPAQSLELVRSLSAGIFGIGFTLRLAAAEAAGAGGRVCRKDGSFRLILPGLTPATAAHTQF